MELVVTVVGREIKQEKTKFTAYALLTASGNWYRVAGIDSDLLEPHDKKVAVVEVSRKFDKTIECADGTVKNFPTLVVRSIREPDAKELGDYNKMLDAVNAATLEGVE